MKIGIDPGHGGNDPGAVGLNGLLEKDVTLSISQKLVAMLQDGGVKTYLTRNIDETMGLLTRTSLINNMKCDYSIAVPLQRQRKIGKRHI